MSLRLAIVADIHHGAPSNTKRGDCAPQLMADFARFVKDTGATHVIDLGDRISDIDHATDLRLEAEVAEMFRAVEVPVSHINGNHDREYLSVAENERILGQSLRNEVLDLGGWRILLWRADTHIHREDTGSSFQLPETDFLWLSAQLQTADRPVLLCSHVPVSGHGQVGHYYFENTPHISTYPQADRVRQALATAKVPVVALSGHVHWNTLTNVNSTIHLTQQSLTEGFTTSGEPAAAMGLLELSDDKVTWEVHGRDPFRFEFTPRVERWTPPMPRFTADPGARHVKG